MPNRFEDLIAHGEGISIEFKKYKDSLPKSIFETLDKHNFGKGTETECFLQ